MCHICVPRPSAFHASVLPSKLFDAAAALEALTVQRATVLVATQEQVQSLADALGSAAKGTYDLSALRTGLVGGCCSEVVLTGQHAHPHSHPLSTCMRAQSTLKTVWQLLAVLLCSAQKLWDFRANVLAYFPQVAILSCFFETKRKSQWLRTSRA